MSDINDLIQETDYNCEPFGVGRAIITKRGDGIHVQPAMDVERTRKGARIFLGGASGAYLTIDEARAVALALLRLASEEAGRGV